VGAIRVKHIMELVAHAHACADVVPADGRATH
jgi:hypothetical protein